MADKPRIRVAAALIARDGHYLITRRKKGVHLAGMWEFPGGKCEAGESYEFCLRREVLEELGVKISEPQLFMIHDHEYPEKIVDLKFFLCSILCGQPRALGCAEWCWVKTEELKRYVFPPADLPVIRQLMRAYDTQHDLSS